MFRVPCSSRAALCLVVLAGLLRGAPARGQDFADVRDFVFDRSLFGSNPEESEGEDEDKLETDRDSFTPATTVMKRGEVLFESSYSMLDLRGRPDSHSFPEILTRIGVTDRIEFRLGWNYEAGGGGSISSSDLIGEEEDAGGIEEEASILYGLKVAVTEQNDWLPRSAFIVQGSTPTAGPDNHSLLNLGYVAGWELPNRWMLDFAVRYLVLAEEDDHYNEWAPSAVLKIPVGERWNVHAEYFGLFTQNREEPLTPQYFSPGVHYYVTNDCEIGVRVGWGLNEDAANFFSNIGIGIRF